MPKICVESPEVSMHGDIQIHARVSVKTTAKLDEIQVRGSCECEDVPPPIVDVVILVDGSDSYNNKVSVKGKIEEGDAFEETVGMIGSQFCPDLAKALDKRSTITVVQFSGIKQLEGKYTPGNDGETGTAGLKHYNIELQPTALTKSTEFNFKNTEGLDGNGQLFLALQDMNMANFLAKLESVGPKLVKGQKRYRFLIVFADEEWDVKKLQTAPEFGSGVTDGVKVCAVNAENYETFAVIVRPNHDADQNEEFITGSLCNGQKSNYNKVYTDKFDVEISRAMNKIVDDIKRRK